MDERSTAECLELAEKFPPEVCLAVTGQMAVMPTWPAAKILWLRNNRPNIYKKAAAYMMLKDYIVYCFTGKKLADMSITTFSLCFDIYRKTYWREMLDAIGISENQLPPCVSRVPWPALCCQRQHRRWGCPAKHRSTWAHWIILPG